METAKAVDHGILFYPRGGSSLVARNLTEQLRARGRPARVFAGSLGDPGTAAHAPSFYGPDHLVASDYSRAASAHGHGLDPLEAPVPLHPSYEDRPGAPDRVFAAVSPRTTMHLADYWTRQFTTHEAGADGLLHLHHLTPQHAAAHRLGLSIVTTLHGTDLKFLHEARRRIHLAHEQGLTVAGVCQRLRIAAHAPATAAGETSGRDWEPEPGDRWESWLYSGFWTMTMKVHALRSNRIVVVSEQDHALAEKLLSLPPERMDIIPNGVDTQRFHPRPVPGDDEKHALLHRWLTEDPQGWLPEQGPGTITYSRGDIDRMIRDRNGQARPLLLWMGRFLAFKHLDLLLHAFAKLLDSAPVRPTLVVLGGYPGEWEGEHPHTLAERLGITDDVYFAGWRPHADLIDGLSISTLFAAPSVGEPFGLVYLEAMASGTPVIASASGGPLGFIRPDGPHPTGWFTAPGDAADLHATLLQALTHPGEIARRGRNARTFVEQHYSWSTICDRYEEVYDRVLTQTSIRASEPSHGRR
ncbi:MAG TPA: glycosyltransferase [Streptomyces sp.]